MIEEYLNFFWQNFLFSFTIIATGFFLGWFLYSKIIIKNISLKEVLFVKDNLAAWIEFIGAFIFPIFYLGGKSIEGPSHSILLYDLCICIVYMIAYIIFFTALRLFSGFFINILGKYDIEGKITLNNEIFKQNNIAAALFSTTLSTFFTNIIVFVDFRSIGDFQISILKMSTILIFTLFSIVIYSISLTKKTTIFKSIFVDNNLASGISLFGFVFAIQLILKEIINISADYRILQTSITILISLLIFGIIISILKLIFTKILNVNFWIELYEQNNIGVAIAQCALYVGVAYVIVNFLH